MGDPEEPANGPQTVSAGGPLHPGMALSGRYLIEKELGRGGIGVVYLAIDRQLMSRPVVVKILLEQSYQDEWIKKKFYQEIEALARIDHPGVVSVFDAGEMPDGKPYLVMQYIEGTSLRQHLGKPMNLSRVARLVHQVSQALAAAHEKGVLHRDLKPENVMIVTTSAGLEEIKLIDFGLAKIRNSTVGESSVVPNVAGSFGYMAPEQLLTRPATTASDIYSLAVIAYEMVTGRRPFLPESVFELYEMQRRGAEIRPRELRPELPQSAEDVILQALSFEPGRRPPTALAFESKLVRSLESGAETEVHGPVSTTSPLAPAPSSNWIVATEFCIALSVTLFAALVRVSFFRFISPWDFFFKPQVLLSLLLLYGLAAITVRRLLARGVTWRKTAPAVSLAMSLLLAAGIMRLPPVIEIASSGGKLAEDPGHYTINYSDPKGYKYTLVEDRYCVISINPGRFNLLTDYTLKITLAPEIEFADVYFDNAFRLSEPLLLQPSNTNDILVVVKKGDRFGGSRNIKFSYKYRIPPQNRRVFVSLKAGDQELTYDGEIRL